MIEDTDLTPEQIKSIEETVERRNQLFEVMRLAKIARIKELAAKINEQERVAAKNKAEARKKGKAAKKARKQNRGN